MEIEKPSTLKIVDATLETHKDLIHQYAKLRAIGKRVSDSSYPETPVIPGDKEAGYLLAVDYEGGQPKVLGGFRLNEVPAGGGKIPADKIEKGRLSNLMPGIDRSKYAILNVDGIALDPGNKRAVHALLEAMVPLARKRNYDAVYFIPKSEIARGIEGFYKRNQYVRDNNILVDKFGETTYKGAPKTMLGVIINPDLQREYRQMKDKQAEFAAGIY